MWFESQTHRGWLQGHFCEVEELKKLRDMVRLTHVPGTAKTGGQELLTDIFTAWPDTLYFKVTGTG